MRVRLVATREKYLSSGPLKGRPLTIILNIRRVAKGKPSSLLRKFVNYGCKKFYNIDTCSLARTFGS
jgi:hypothetical protein